MTLESESLKNFSKNAGPLFLKWGIKPLWTLCFAAPKVSINMMLTYILRH